ncbi:hypothetical protein Bca52824_078805 [Brassica carinata]|uniref:Uncharacterized protein n=1 Tax=Brassica carinata TaxID=52824 RepID=A0A8X7PWN4_BRACI|nr:hypothetical protein Bca52824_078805 [Brassica carinata]
MRTIGHIITFIIRSSKILSPFTGTLEVFSKPIKTSDIVSQNSTHFITDSTLLQIGHRVTAVSPDEFLRPRRDLYLLLPTDMLFSVLTQEELALISEKQQRYSMKVGITI